MPGKPKRKPQSAVSIKPSRKAPRPAAKPRSPVRRRGNASTADKRRTVILAAALDVFSRHGFAMARLDDVAAKAGIAKGTLYLYFESKEALFEELIRSFATPIFEDLEAVADAAPPAALINRFFELFRTEVLGTERKLILQLRSRRAGAFPLSRSSIIARSSRAACG
jgi:AcrR family transcriptional regulator